MRKLIAAVLVTVGLAAVLAGPVGAAPDNSKGAETITLNCGAAGSVTVLVQFNSSGVAVFDASLATNGRQYVLSWIDGRFYEGTFTTEPAGDPDFAFSKTWGERNGYSRTLSCSAGPIVETDEFGTFTGFFDVIISAK